MSDSSKSRIEWIDALKAFAIVLVVLGHAIQYTLPGSAFKEDPIFLFIYSFHMPLFMTMSGMFFMSSLKLGFADFMKKKSLQLLLPAVTWSLICCAFKMSIEFRSFFNPSWFLYSVFLCYLVYYLLAKSIERITAKTLNGGAFW